MTVQMNNFADIEGLKDEQIINHLSTHREDIPSYLQTIKEHAEYVSNHQGAVEFALSGLNKKQSESVQSTIADIFLSLRSEQLGDYEQRLMQMSDDELGKEVIECIQNEKSFELKEILTIASDKLHNMGKETYSKFLDELLQHKNPPQSDEMLYLFLDKYPIPEEEKFLHFKKEDESSGPQYRDNILHKAIRFGYTHNIPSLVDQCPVKYRDEFWKENDEGCKRTLMHAAAAKGDINAIEALIQLWPDAFQDVLWQPDGDGFSPLFFGGDSGNPKAVATLLKNCPDKYQGQLWQKGRYEQTVFQAGIQSGNTELIEILIDACPSGLIDEFWQSNLLHMAASSGNPDAVRVIMRKCPDQYKEALWKLTQGKATVLYEAVVSGNTDVVNTVLENCPDTFYNDLWGGDWLGNTPMYEAARSGNVAIINMLSEKCPKSSQAKLWKNGRYRNIINQAPNLESIKALAKGCPPQFHSELWCEGVLAKAATDQTASIVEALIKNCPENCQLQIWGQDKSYYVLEGATKLQNRASIIEVFIHNCPEQCENLLWRRAGEALCSVLERGDEASANLLFDECPDKYRKMLLLHHSLHSAAQGGNAALITKLLDACAKTGIKYLWNAGYNNRTPLHKAALSGKAEAIKAIVDACPFPDKGWIEDWKRKNPFHFVVQRGDIEAIEALISAFPEKKDQLWKTAEPTVLQAVLDSKNIKAIEWLIQHCPDTYLDHVFEPDDEGMNFLDKVSMKLEMLRALLLTRPDKIKDLHAVFMQLRKDKGMAFCADLIESLPEDQADRVLNATDQRGLKFYQYCFTPPHDGINKIGSFWPRHEEKPPLIKFMLKKLNEPTAFKDKRDSLLVCLMSRIVERYPTFTPPPDVEKQIRDFTETALASQDNELLNVIAFDYKFNPSLPLTPEALQRILEALEKCVDDRVKKAAFRIALQTYPNFDLIFSVADVDMPLRPFPTKKEFLGLSTEDQRALMCRAQVLRQRDALAAAGHIVKKAVLEGDYDRDLLIFSLMLYSQTEAEGSKNLQKRLAVLFQDIDLDPEIRKQAALAFAKVEQDPSHAERKQQLFDAYAETDQADLKSVFLEALSSCHFTSSKADADFAGRLIEESKTASDNLRQSMAYVLSLIPSQDALKASLAIVNSDTWNQIEEAKMLGEEQMISGHYMIFSYRPVYHDGRSSMKRIIAERLMLLHRDTKAQKVEDLYTKYAADKDSYPEVKAVDENIRSFIFDGFNTIQAQKNLVRYYPQNIYLPPRSVLYRGLRARKGDELAEVAYDDLFVKGTGSADLTYYNTHDKGTWGKIGHVFSSASLDYVMHGYFDDAGILLTIDGDHLNEAFLRRGGRIETEDSLHYVSYDTIKHHAINQIFMSREREERMEKISLGSHQVKVETGDPKHNKIQKMMNRRLNAPQKEKRPSLKDRITYFNFAGSGFEYLVQACMRTLGLRETTTEGIVEENVKRQIARRLVADKLEDPDLRECMEFAIREASTPVS